MWGLNETVYSREMAKRMVWLSALLPYEQCQSVFERIGERQVPASSIWRQTQQHGQRLLGQKEHHRQQVSVERVRLPDEGYDHAQRKGLSMDGGMVNIRGEGWRELKVGAVFDVEIRLERNPETKLLEEMAHGVATHYTAVLGDKAVFTPALWALAVEHDLPTARERAVVADGAPWIWNVAEDVCPDGRQIVDWFHASQHLALAAQTLYPEDNPHRQRWYKDMKDHLFQGQLQPIIISLTQAGHAEMATYFDRHQRRMQYLEFREEGWPLGSGTVESGVKQFKQRLSASGMRWNPNNANRMLVIRSAVLGNDFDALWDAA
jgi:hypothetical protein